MSGLDTMTDEQFERHALDVLARELAVDGLARFLPIAPVRTWPTTRRTGCIGRRI